MADDRVESRLRALLAERAENVAFSGDGWEGIQRRLSRRRPTWTRPVLALTTAATVAAMIAVTSALRPDTGIEIAPVDQPSTADTPRGDTAPTPRSYRWERVDIPDEVAAAEGIRVYDAAADGETVVVVGSGGLVWRSGDGGASWERVADATFAATADVRGVVAGPTGFVAVGGNDGVGLVWTSPDGRSWTAMEGHRDAHFLYDVAYGGGAYVATGVGDGNDAVAFTSIDSRTWEKAEVDRAAAGAKNTMLVVAYGARGWVASGHGAGESQLATMWHSLQGRTWDLVDDSGVTEVFLGGDDPEDGEDTPPVIDAVTADRSGYLAFRAGGQVYRSGDGRKWTAASKLKGDVVLRIAGAVRTADGWLAVGSLGERAWAFVSEDGNGWVGTPLVDQGRAAALTVTGDGTAVAAGEDSGRLAVWRRIPERASW